MSRWMIAEHLAEMKQESAKIAQIEEVCYVLRDKHASVWFSGVELEQGSGRTSMEVLAYLLPFCRNS